MLDVTCAIIRNEEDEILVVQRGEKTDHPYKWEFPGGKISKDESEEDCILREIDEELSMNIVLCGRLDPVDYDYGHKQIRLIPFICDTLDELPFLSEHIAYKWLNKNQLISVDFCEADQIVAAAFLKKSGIEENENIAENISKQPSSEDSDLQGMINKIMSMQEAEWIATSAIENPAIFQKLLDYSFSNDKKLAFRSSWTLTKVCDRFPDLIVPHIPEIIDSLAKLENESAQRSFLRIISLSDLKQLSGRQHGLLADHCFTALKSGISAIAIKAYSMEILYRLAVIYPDLASELAATIRILMEDGSAGITSRGKTILRKLAEISMKEE